MALSFTVRAVNERKRRLTVVCAYLMIPRRFNFSSKSFGIIDLDSREGSVHDLEAYSDFNTLNWITRPPSIIF